MSAVLQFDYSIRPMNEHDLEQVMDIELLVYPFPWTHGIFVDCLRVGYSCWVCQDRNSILGYAVMSMGVNEVHLLNICIHPEQQNKGLGRKFLLHMCDVASNYHADTLLLEVRPSNRAALFLYKNIGFNEVGLRKDYYPAINGREDAIIMAMSI